MYLALILKFLYKTYSLVYRLGGKQFSNRNLLLQFFSRNVLTRRWSQLLPNTCDNAKIFHGFCRPSLYLIHWSYSLVTWCQMNKFIVIPLRNYITFFTHSILIKWSTAFFLHISYLEMFFFYWVSFILIKHFNFISIISLETDEPTL